MVWLVRIYRFHEREWANFRSRLTPWAHPTRFSAAVCCAFYNTRQSFLLVFAEPFISNIKTRTSNNNVWLDVLLSQLYTIIISQMLLVSGVFMVCIRHFLSLIMMLYQYRLQRIAHHSSMSEFSQIPVQGTKLRVTCLWCSHKSLFVLCETKFYAIDVCVLLSSVPMFYCVCICLTCSNMCLFP